MTKVLWNYLLMFFFGRSIINKLIESHLYYKSLWYMYIHLKAYGFRNCSFEKKDAGQFWESDVIIKKYKENSIGKRVILKNKPSTLSLWQKKYGMETQARNMTMHSYLPFEYWFDNHETGIAFLIFFFWNSNWKKNKHDWHLEWVLYEDPWWAQEMAWRKRK